MQDASRVSSPKSCAPKDVVESIPAPRNSVEGERKQVTVLFADIRGSMELIADRDPEEAQTILEPVLDCMVEAVHHYEGTVNKVMGDGIIALFGAPLSHEDHAVRACYASLRMQDAVARYAREAGVSHGNPVMIRVGLNSGEIVVRSIGSDLYFDYNVIGPTVHLAARMEQMANPGAVLATANTLRLAEGYIAVKPLGPIPVKGLPAPVEVYEITGSGFARTKLQAAARRGLTPFVGRRDEMNVLHQALDHVRCGDGWLAAVVGEPGVGKSRLVYEFVHSPAMADCLVLEASAASYGRAMSYLPVIELLRSFFRINDHDSTEKIGAKVTERVLALDHSLQDIIPPLLDLFDALGPEHPFQAMDPLQHRQLTHRAVARLLLSESREHPMIVVIEDLHWSDSLTLGLLSEIVTSADDARLLLVVSYRPEFRDAWSGQVNYSQLALDPLATDNLEELLDALLGASDGLSNLKQLMLDLARGNPFFAEEIVRSLVDGGVLEGVRGSYRLVKALSSIEVPPTVQAVLAARIDRLPAAQKRLLQEASVIGHHVPFALLQAISGLSEGELRDLLNALQTAVFLYATRLFPDLQYTFKHSLTHDVAYAGLLNRHRRSIHARIVGAIEMLYADRLNEQIERLADHALRGEIWEKAVGYLRQAGTRAAEREAYVEAVTLFEQALGALVQLPESRATLELAIDLRFDIRNVLQPLGDRVRIATYLHEAELLTVRLNDKSRTGWVQSYLTEQLWMLGRYAEAVKAGKSAISIAEQLDDLPLQVVTNLPLGLAYHTRGDYRQAIDCFNWIATRLGARESRERFGMFVLPAAFSRSFMAWGLAELGDFDDGLKIGCEALTISEAAGHPFSCGYAHLGLGVLALRQGNVRRALRSFEQALAAGAFADSPVGFAFVALHLGYALALLGRSEEGIAILEKSIKVAETKGFVARHALRLSYVSEAYFLVGNDNEAMKAGMRALELARAHHERANEAYALRILGRIKARGGDPIKSEARYREALAMSKILGLRPLEAHCHRDIAELLMERGHAVAARVHETSAMALVHALKMHFGKIAL